MHVCMGLCGEMIMCVDGVARVNGALRVLVLLHSASRVG